MLVYPFRNYEIDKPTFDCRFRMFDRANRTLVRDNRDLFRPE